MTAFRTEDVLKVSVTVLKEMYNVEKRTQFSFKTIILVVYFDTSFISQVLNVERLFSWRESAEVLVLSSVSLNCCSPICLTALTAHTIS